MLTVLRLAAAAALGWALYHERLALRANSPDPHKPAGRPVLLGFHRLRGRRCSALRRTLVVWRTPPQAAMTCREPWRLTPKTESLHGAIGHARERIKSLCGA